MPWKIEKQNDSYCVINQDTGKSVGCHSTRDKANKHLSALYANVEEQYTTNDLGIIVTAPISNPGISLLCARDLDYDPHITLGIAKSPDSYTCCTFANIVGASVVDQYLSSLEGRASGVGLFTPTENSDGKYVVYIVPSVVGLDHMRSQLIPKLWILKSDFGWTPHITASYQSSLPLAVEAARSLIAVFTLTTVPVTIDKLVISDFSPDKTKRLNHRHEIPLPKP